MRCTVPADALERRMAIPRIRTTRGGFASVQQVQWGGGTDIAFLAEESGAHPVKGVDVFGSTPEFDETHAARNSSIEFILGDAMDPATVERIGIVDVVFCAGVLYHHPSPFDLLVSLRRMCRETLVLRTSAIRGRRSAQRGRLLADPAGKGAVAVGPSVARPPGRGQQGLRAQRRLRELVLGAHTQLPCLITANGGLSCSAAVPGALCRDVGLRDERSAVLPPGAERTGGPRHGAATTRGQRALAGVPLHLGPR